MTLTWALLVYAVLHLAVYVRRRKRDVYPRFLSPFVLGLGVWAASDLAG